MRYKLLVIVLVLGLVGSSAVVVVGSMGPAAGGNGSTTDDGHTHGGAVEVTVSGQLATDPDCNGRYEDVNGQNGYDIVDVQALFAHLDDAAVQDHPGAFDFNDDGSVNVVDAQKLFVDGVNPPESADVVVGPSESVGEYRSLDNATGAAEDGDTVYLCAGEYRQSVDINETPNLTLTGAGQGKTVLKGGKLHHEEHSHDDGDGHNESSGSSTGESGYGAYEATGSAAQQSASEEEGGHAHGDAISITTDGVTVSDLSVKYFGGNGVYYQGVTGFQVSNVSTVFNGAYGIYAIRSTDGVFEDSYASGHFDSGYYLGEVENCDCVIRNVTGEGNLIAYSGTGASDILITDSSFRDNAAGVVPNVLPNEPSPQLNLTVRDNEIVNNNNATAYRDFHFAGSLHGPIGSGVVIAGGSNNTVADNRIADNDRAGVLLTYLFAEPSFNEIRNNSMENPDDTDYGPLEGEGVDIWWDATGVGNCFSGNEHTGNGDVTFDAGTLQNERGLPECDGTPSAGAGPSPKQMRSIASVVVYGCEYEQLQANNESCHVEEPAPHVHPPSAPSSTAEVLNAMDDAAAPGTAKQAVVDDLRGYYEQVNGSAS